MIEPLFAREHIDGMRPHIQQTVDSLLDALIKEGGDKPVDLVEKFALPVPSYVCANFGSIISVPHAEGLINRSSMASWEYHSRISSISLNALPSEAMGVPQQLKPPMPISIPSI
jgi:cytochrome P450